MQYLDQMFCDFSEAFLGLMEGEGDIPYRDNLLFEDLNYSLDSLRSLDRYLSFLHKRNKSISGIEYQNLIVWCGAYLGEVIRRNAKNEYHWIGYKDYMIKVDSGIKNMIPLELTTHAFLVEIKSLYMTMPLNKIARWLAEGKENSTHFYASVDISR